MAPPFPGWLGYDLPFISHRMVSSSPLRDPVGCNFSSRIKYSPYKHFWRNGLAQKNWRMRKRLYGMWSCYLLVQIKKTNERWWKRRGKCVPVYWWKSLMMKHWDVFGYPWLSRANRRIKILEDELARLAGDNWQVRPDLEIVFNKFTVYAYLPSGNYTDPAMVILRIITDRESRLHLI
jgi:hypothetical protein